MLQEPRVFTYFDGMSASRRASEKQCWAPGQSSLPPFTPPVPEKSGEGGRSREDCAAIPNFPPQVLASWDEDKVSWEMPTRPEVSKRAGMHFKICSHLKGMGSGQDALKDSTQKGYGEPAQWPARTLSWGGGGDTSGLCRQVAGLRPRR